VEGERGEKLRVFSGGDSPEGEGPPFSFVSLWEDCGFGIPRGGSVVGRTGTRG